MRPIVVGVDGSPSALHAVRWAATEAGRRGAPLRLVHACALVPPGLPHQITHLGDYPDVLLGQGRHWLATATNDARVIDRTLDVGSVAVTLAAHAHSPVVVVRSSTVDSPPPLTGPVVVGVGGSPLSEAAIAFAVEAWIELQSIVDWTAMHANEERIRGVLAGPGLGSVSQTLLHEAPCPVAVIRPEVGRL